MPRKDKNILTKVQRVTLDALRHYIAEHKRSPTLAELAVLLKVKLPTVSDRIRALQKKGFVRKTPHAWRNLEVIDSKSLGRTVHVPLIASVGADNMTVFAQHEFEQFLRVDEKLLNGHRDVFSVRAIGNSMRDADIFDGDYVLAEHASLEDVHTGDKVIAILGEMAVVKRIQIGKGSVVLHPENTSGRYHPHVITGDRDDFRVVGRVIDVLHFSESSDDDDIQYHEIKD